MKSVVVPVVIIAGEEEEEDNNDDDDDENQKQDQDSVLRELHDAYEATVWHYRSNNLQMILVDAIDGSVLYSGTCTANDSYKVFLQSPLHDHNTQTVVQGPTGSGSGSVSSSSSNESPAGWLSRSEKQTSISIQGNNVQAYLDWDSSNSPDAGKLMSLMRFLSHVFFFFFLFKKRIPKISFPKAATLSPRATFWQHSLTSPNPPRTKTKPFQSRIYFT